MKGKLILFLIILGAGWLAYANPSMEDFESFTREQSQDYLADELGDTVVGRAIAQAGASIAGDYVDQVVDRKNYVLLSVYEVGNGEDVNEGENEDSWKYLGIGGKFVKLDSK